MTKNVLKFAGGFLALLILGLGAFWVIQYYQYRQNPEQQALNEFEKIKKLYDEDTYGGSTPEETLALFIDALKKGDIGLATKYVLIDDQEKVHKDLLQVKTAGNLNEVIERLLSVRRSKISDDEAWFVITDQNRVVQYSILLGKNQKDVWKILEL